MTAEQTVRANEWRKERADIFRWEQINSLDSRNYLWKKESLALLEITTDIDTIPEKSTWYVMTQIPGVLAKEGGNLYRNRT